MACCFTVRAEVSALCCDDNGCAGSLDVTLNNLTGNPVRDSEGRIVNCGPVGFYRVDPATCCAETCSLPANGDLDQPTTYDVCLSLPSGESFTYENVFIPATVCTDPDCPPVIDFVDLPAYQGPVDIDPDSPLAEFCINCPPGPAGEQGPQGPAGLDGECPDCGEILVNDGAAGTSRPYADEILLHDDNITALPADITEVVPVYKNEQGQLVVAVCTIADLSVSLQGQDIQVTITDTCGNSVTGSDSPN